VFGTLNGERKCERGDEQREGEESHKVWRVQSYGHDDGTYFGERDRGKIRQMETFAYPHFSSTVHVALFVHVTNSAKLRARIIRASTLDGVEGQAEREAVNFAFVDARLVRHCLCTIVWTLRLRVTATQVTSILHIQTAITQALLAAVQNALRTKTVHSEVIWALNPSNNVSSLSISYLVARHRELLPSDYRSITSLRCF